MKKVALLLATLLPTGLALGQTSAPGNTAPPILEKPYEAARDFFNYFATLGADYDSNGQYVGGGTGRGSAEGLTIGGGISGVHTWATSMFSLSYRGNYNDYFGGFGHTDQQSLIALYQKRWRRWTLNASISGGILYEQATAYGTDGSGLVDTGSLVQSNPFSTETRYASAQVGMSYLQTQRLSYSFSGSYLIDRYNSLAASGFHDPTGSVSVNYRLTRRTSFGGTYSHSDYVYQHNIGSNQVDNLFLNVEHDFASHIILSASAGGTRASGAGSIVFPTGLFYQGQPLYIRENYHQTNYLPYLAFTASKQYQHTSMYVNASESVTPGNGIFLTSRTIGVSGSVNQQFRRSNAGIGASYSRLEGALTLPGYGQTTTRGIDVSYSYNLLRHVGVNARYDYLSYGSYGFLQTKPDNHLQLSIYFESKDIPLTLY